MRRLAAGLLLVLSTTMVMGQGSAVSDPLAPLAWLVGGTWKAEVPNPKGGSNTKIEQHMERTLGGKAIRFVTKFDSVVQYEGFFAYDAAKKQIFFAYPSASGDLTTGVASEEPGGVLADFTISNADATAAHYQVHMKRDGADDYTWALLANSGGAWSKMFEVKYHRES
jgi:hypothetical protein